jgi:hypothetical protein
MKLSEFSTNPSGAGSSYLYSRDAIRADIARRYASLRESGGKFDISVYSWKDDPKRKVFHVKVPSESVPGFYFDIVLDVIGGFTSRRAFLGSDVQVFSNSPSWTFTYAYVAKKVGLVVPWLEGKVGDFALSTPPRETNPPEALGFEKTTSMALAFILDTEGFLAAASAPTLKKKQFTSSIRDCQQIVSDYQTAEKKVRAEKRKEVNREKKKVEGTSKPSKTVTRPGATKARKAKVNSKSKSSSKPKKR